MGPRNASSILTLTLFGAVACTDSTGPASAALDDSAAVDLPVAEARRSKVVVCHRRGTGSFKKIAIGAPALHAHLAHGDGQPDGDVPGSPGFVFGENCEIEEVPLLPPILFQRGDGDIWAMNPDGSGSVNLTNTPTVSEGGARWSPDGRSIVFDSDEDGPRNIYVLDTRTGLRSQITDDPLDDGGPAWSPDGTQIVFSRRVANLNSDLFLVGRDGSGLLQLTSGSANDGGAQFFEDGSEILYRHDTPGFNNVDLFAIRPDGTGMRNATNSPLPFTDGFDWIPGTTQLFANGQEGLGQQFDVYLFDLADGSFLRLTTNPAFELGPHSSPDGSSVVYSSRRSGTFQIFRLDLGTMVETQVSDGAPFDQFVTDWRN